ncbi:probable G-protein coupled receptor No18 [Branchiostoma floridae]|uniref:Probable G-protein coupled receptor No18 n=1 Tax=Branchiostoma floridae TaxID=7739 RepID=A0A9J7MU45_BRAFL|nr:probable G-protein coupled receptor No18 [Branchiostoma floridae]
MSGELRSLVPVPPNTSVLPCPLDGTGPVAELDRQIAHQQLPVIVLLLLVCILGTVGNLLVILVSIHRRRKSSATVFILALAGVDLFISAVTIPMRVFSYFHYSFSAPGWCELESCLTVGSLVSSLLLLIAIAEDRLRAVRRPTHFYMAGNRRAVHVSVAVLIAGFVLSLPYLMTAHEGAFLLPERNCTVTACFGITTNNHAWFLVSFILITIPFFSSGFIIVVIYAMVYKRVYDSRAAAMAMGRVHASLQTETLQLQGRLQRENTESLQLQGRLQPENTESLQLQGRLHRGNSEALQQETGCGSDAFPEPVTTRPAQHVVLQREETGVPRESITSRPAQRVVLQHHFRLAKMLLLVTAVFLVTWLSHVILTIYVMTTSSDAYHKLSDVELRVSDFFQHLYFLNSALNPIIYTIAYKSFRQRLLALFGRMTPKRNIYRVNEDNFLG